VNKYIGIPFSDGEPSLKGANCYSLIELIYKEEFGIELPKIRISALNSRRAFIEYLKQVSEHWIKIDEPEINCVVVMAHDMKHPKVIQHFGLYIGDGKVLHTLNKINSHIKSLDSLKPFIKGYYKWQS